MSASTLSLRFPDICGRKVVSSFDGGELSSDAGVLMLGAADKRVGLVSSLSEAALERRERCKIKHSLDDMLRERIFAVAMGYEDANDLDYLRNDPALKVACRKLPLAQDALASQPTISRLENSMGARDLFRMGMRMALVVVSQLPSDTKEVTLDIDATDDPCYGQQELIRFDGHYGHVCYLPLYMHITDERGKQRLLGTLLRSACGRSLTGVMAFVRLAVRVVRERFADAHIVLRGDCNFGCGQLMNWCDQNRVGYVFGLRAATVKTWMLPVQMEAARMHKFHGDGYRRYEDFRHQGGSWTCARRVVAKVEISKTVVDTRCIVTSEQGRSAEQTYKWYAQRGDRENRIKEMKLDLVSGRTSCHRFLANQFRLLLHTAACVLMGVLQHALDGTKWENAQVGTVRLRLLKVGARIVQSCRRIWLHFPTSFPDKEGWEHLHKTLHG